MTSEKKPAGKRNPKFVWQSAFIESGLTGNTGFVGLLMSTLDNGDGEGFFISYKRMAEMTTLSERTCQTQVQKLVELGWIVRTRRGGNQGGRNRASWYQLLVPASSEPATENSQPEVPTAQPEAGFQVVDPVTSLDHPQVDPTDLGSLQDGDEVHREVVAGLSASGQAHFSPAFDDDQMMVFSASPLWEVPETTERKVDTRSERAQRRSMEYALREEGLDPMGEPLPKRDRRSSRTHSP